MLAEGEFLGTGEGDPQPRGPCVRPGTPQEARCGGQARSGARQAEGGAQAFDPDAPQVPSCRMPECYCRRGGMTEVR